MNCNQIWEVTLHSDGFHGCCNFVSTNFEERVPLFVLRILVSCWKCRVVLLFMKEYTWMWIVKGFYQWLSSFSAAYPSFNILLCDVWVGILNYTSALSPYFLFESYTEEALGGVSKVGIRGRYFPIFLLSFHGLQFLCSSYDPHPNNTSSPWQLQFCHVAAAQSSLKFF